MLVPSLQLHNQEVNSLSMLMTTCSSPLKQLQQKVYSLSMLKAAQYQPEIYNLLDAAKVLVPSLQLHNQEILDICQNTVLIPSRNLPRCSYSVGPQLAAPQSGGQQPLHADDNL